VCNFRCTYCLPDGYKKPCQRPAELTVEEIRRAVTAFAQLGLWKVRLTGGEPTLRRDFENVARAVSSVPGIRRVAMTTNGYRLAERAPAWRECGVSAINISVDRSIRRALPRSPGMTGWAKCCAGLRRRGTLGLTASN
jgi:cyclic pyranopterin phosphate synthase